MFTFSFQKLQKQLERRVEPNARGGEQTSEKFRINRVSSDPICCEGRYMRLIAIFCIALSIAGCGDKGEINSQRPAAAGVDFSYDKNAFINYWSCLGVYPGTSLALGEKVWIFSKDQAPMFGKVVHVISAEEAQKEFNAVGFDKVYADKSLWAKIGCAHHYRGGMPASLARVNPEPKDQGDLGIVIRGLPESVWIAEGIGASVPMETKDNPYVEAVRTLVTDACYAADSLVRVRRFPVRNGRPVIQLDIGRAKKASPEQRKQYIDEQMQQSERVFTKEAWPKYKEEKLSELEKIDQIESVEICRFYLDDMRVLKSEKISRRTGEEERVETAPELNTENWADTTNRAIGFISLNEGKDWDALFVDVGWEGIGYSIERLNGPIELYSRSLYTYH